ncbi:MAG TPA: hypothetical protein VFL29_06055 [Candidatus Dormibacteraeota bacterium]|nr:hypothetical protein [Candidatus Dormibacteraeota bacterium]
MRKVFGGAGAALGAKLLTGFAVAALAVGAAGVTTEVATTGSINPNDWGQQVSQQVQTCKDTLRASGVRGIGQCVSAFAKQHGKAVSAEHRNSDARTNSHGNNGKDNKNNGKNGQHGKPSDLPHQP